MSTLYQKTKPETYPECARDKSNQGTAEAGFFTIGSDPLVNALPQPNVRVDVPGIQKDLHIRGQLDFQNFDVRCTLPEGLARRSKSGETESSQDAGSLKGQISCLHTSIECPYLRQSPDSVVFAALDEPKELENSNPGRFTELDASLTWGVIIPVEEALFREPWC